MKGESVAVLEGVLAYTGTAQGAKNAGVYTITPQGLSSVNYQINYGNGQLTISSPVTPTVVPTQPTVAPVTPVSSPIITVEQAPKQFSPVLIVTQRTRNPDNL